jgi:hypothetical protein
LWKTSSLIIASWQYLHDPACAKSVIFHIILIAAVAVDIPMYISLLLTNEYSLVTYSFHKFSSALLFVGYSLTIYDWSNVLYDIREIDHKPLFFRRNTLILINVFMITMSVANFIYMYTCRSLDGYLKSPLYVALIFIQITAAFLLTGLMLSAGIRLSVRIQGASKELSSTNIFPQSSKVAIKTPNRGLQSAVNRLTGVMLVCFVCITIQVGRKFYVCRIHSF